MSDMFGKAPQREPVPSEAGDALDQSTGGGVFTKEQGARRLAGRGRVGVDPRKFRYDVVRGRGAALPFAVSRDDRMDAQEAGQMLHDLHVMCGLEAANESVLSAFDAALFFCHTVNGGSVLNPGRSRFFVRLKDGEFDGTRLGDAVTEEFDFAKVRDKLGDAMRRFFRAYADEVTEVNKRVLRDYDPYDPVSHEQWGWLMEVAHDRGLSRYPYLAHDSADACLSLSTVERQALRTSKALVIGGTPNSADRMQPKGAVRSADGFDSSVGGTY